LNIKEDVAATFYMFAEWGKKKSKEKEKNEVYTACRLSFFFSEKNMHIQELVNMRRLTLPLKT
jgi:hypothetical protein